MTNLQRFVVVGSLLLATLLAQLALIGAISEEEQQQQQEREEAERRALLRDSYKRLFRRQEPLEPAEALKLLQNLYTVYGSSAPAGVHETPIDTAKLLAYAQVSEAKCDEASKVIEMRQDHELVRRNYPALLPYVSHHFRAQFELCGFHNKYKEDFKNFKEKDAKRWASLSGFKNRMAKFGKIAKDWKGEKKNNPTMVNEAFSDLYEDEKRGGDRGDAAIRAYRQAHEIIDGAEQFAREVGPSARLATYHPDSMSDEELRELMRHNNAYRQAANTNYAPSMDSMFADAYYNQDDSAWQKYQGWANMWA